MLVRLLYASRAHESVDAEQLAGILRQCKENNPKRGVTGVLCFSGGIFLQALEGGRTAVNQLYHRIASDCRHRDVTLLSYEETRERRFASWWMGQVSLARVNSSLVLKYSESTELDPFSLPGGVCLSLLEDLVLTASVGTQA